MKKFDYIVIQAPMISELGLKGNSLLLFAMIHGFSKDGKNRFRASLDEMAEWLITSKGAISSTLKALEKAGYITKHDVKDSNKDKPEYSTNYEALMAKVDAEGSLKLDRIYAEKEPNSARVLIQYPKKKAVESMGTESVRVLKQYRKGTESVPKKGTESVPNKYNINIYKYYSCCYGELTEAQKQEEEKQFLKLFFFRGAADPAAEVKRFVGHNQAKGWKDSSGAIFDTTEKRLGIAELWKFQLGERNAKVFLKVWKEVYSKVEAVEGSDVLLDPRISFSYDNSAMTINCTQKVAKFLEGHLSEVKEIILAHAAGKRVCYKYI